MKLLLTKNLPLKSLDLMRSYGWTVTTAEALSINLSSVTSFSDNADVWIVSSRHSLATIEKFKPMAPALICVVGSWTKERIEQLLPSVSVRSFNGIKELSEELAALPFSKAIYFCADNHRSELEDRFRRQPNRIENVVTHESRMTFPILSGVYDAVMIFSPRSAESILKNNLFGPSTLFACIGRTTEQWLHEHSFTNTFCASVPDNEILIREFFESGVSATMQKRSGRAT